MSLTVELGEMGFVTAYSANITHNLNKMADEAGLYTYLWRPEESVPVEDHYKSGADRASYLIPHLRRGLNLLVSYPERFRKLNPKNGWGSYEGLVKFVREYLDACEHGPDLIVRVSR